MIAIVGLVAAYFFVRRGQRRAAAFLVASALAGLALNNVLKIVVGRSRPHFDRAVSSGFGKSFPSGHAMNSTVVYGTIVMPVWLRFQDRRIRTLSVVTAVVLVSAIAASRVVLGVHYVSDVLAGMALGLAFVLISAAGFRFWRTISQ